MVRQTVEGWLPLSKRENLDAGFRQQQCCVVVAFYLLPAPKRDSLGVGALKGQGTQALPGYRRYTGVAWVGPAHTLIGGCAADSSVSHCRGSVVPKLHVADSFARDINTP